MNNAVLSAVLPSKGVSSGPPDPKPKSMKKSSSCHPEPPRLVLKSAGRPRNQVRQPSPTSLVFDGCPREWTKVLFLGELSRATSSAGVVGAVVSRVARLAKGGWFVEFVDADAASNVLAASAQLTFTCGIIDIHRAGDKSARRISAEAEAERRIFIRECRSRISYNRQSSC